MILKTTLEGTTLDKFNALKEKTGIKNDSDLIRLAISNTYIQMVEKNGGK